MPRIDPARLTVTIEDPRGVYRILEEVIEINVEPYVQQSSPVYGAGGRMIGMTSRPARSMEMTLTARGLTRQDTGERVRVQVHRQNVTFGVDSLPPEMIGRIISMELDAEGVLTAQIAMLAAEQPLLDFAHQHGFLAAMEREISSAIMGPEEIDPQLTYPTTVPEEPLLHRPETQAYMAAYEKRRREALIQQRNPTEAPPPKRPSRFERAEIETISVAFTIEATTRLTRFDRILQEVA